MITNFDTNKVYLAKGMTSENYVDATGHLLGTLHNHKISWNFLPRRVTICLCRLEKTS